MPRRAKTDKRSIAPDGRYQSLTVTRIVNKIMLGGKKSIAERIVYDALDLLERRNSGTPVAILDRAVKNVTPLLEVKPRRVGGATYQVPVEVRPDRALSLSIRWLVRSARARGGKSMAAKLADEIMDASKGQGTAAKKREDTHRMAEANRAFAHYRW
jgi:small subunit ribosomal protein S7